MHNKISIQFKNNIHLKRYIYEIYKQSTCIINIFYNIKVYFSGKICFCNTFY